jgi:hypothetical protein
MREPVVEAKEPVKRNFVGLIVAFDLRRIGGATTREKGEVTAQRWLGLTTRGAIPEYELTIVGKTGRSVLARLTEDHVQPLD